MLSCNIFQSAFKFAHAYDAGDRHFNDIMKDDFALYILAYQGKKQGGIALELTMKLFLFLALIDDDAYEPFVQGRVSEKIGINICHICRCTYRPAV